MQYDIPLFSYSCHAPENLVNAIKIRDFPLAERLVVDQSLTPEDAAWLLHLSMESIPITLVKAIWSHCTDCTALLKERGHLTDFTCPALASKDERKYCTNWHHTVVESAAYADRLDILDFLHQQGAELFPANAHILTPLEASVAGNAPVVTAYLLEQGGSAIPLTDHMVKLFCQRGRNPALELAWVHFFEEMFSLTGSGPLPDSFTLSVIVETQNWTFLLRYLQNHRLSQKERCRVIQRMNWVGLVKCAPQHLSSVLNILLTACPELLRYQQILRLLAGAALLPEDGIPAELQHWVNRLPAQVELRCNDGFVWGGPNGLLIRWNSRLGSRVRPVMSRNQCLPVVDPENPWSHIKTSSQEVAQVLNACKIVGKSGCGVSLLLESVLYHADPAALARAVDSQNLLEGEDLEDLKTRCQHHNGMIREENRKYLMDRFSWKEAHHE